MNARTEVFAESTSPAWQPASFEGCDETELRQHSRDSRYCPTELLADFALLMAGHGRCVITAMMLGDREYAMWQLGCARAMGDSELEAVSTRLFSYFEHA